MPREYVVPHREQQLMSKVDRPIDDGCRGNQESAAANQPGRQVSVAPGAVISVVVTLVDHDESSACQRELPPAHLFVRAEMHRHPESSCYCLPLAYDRSRDEAGGRVAFVEQRGDPEGNEGLPAA